MSAKKILDIVMSANFVLSLGQIVILSLAINNTKADDDKPTSIYTKIHAP